MRSGGGAWSKESCSAAAGFLRKEREKGSVRREGMTRAQVRAAARSVEVIDFFCGCGGTSAGLRDAGMRIVGGIDNDPDSAASFRLNFRRAAVLEQDVSQLQSSDVEGAFSSELGRPRMLSACAPCQPFSKQRTGKPKARDKRAPLLREFQRFVEALEPDLIFLENVPGLQRGAGRHRPFRNFVLLLGKLGYQVEFDVVRCEDYGVPQRRRRLILMASRLGPIALPAPTHGGKTGRAPSTVWDWIGDLPPIQAGGVHPEVRDHRAMRLSRKNLERIAATPLNGSRVGWPEDLVLDCHRGDHDGHTDVYGRMPRDRPAPALTTRCISLSNGRFGHPEQDRAISVREAARLQTFGPKHRFGGCMTSQARQIGNAVPVLLARRVGDAFARHVAEHGR